MKLPYTYIANLTQQLPEIPADSIISRTLHNDDQVKAVLFAFAAGQELSEHTAAIPAVLHFIQGNAELTLGEDPLEAGQGTWVHLPARLPHTIVAKTAVIMLLLLLKSEAKK